MRQPWVQPIGRYNRSILNFASRVNRSRVFLYFPSDWLLAAYCMCGLKSDPESHSRLSFFTTHSSGLLLFIVWARRLQTFPLPSSTARVEPKERGQNQLKLRFGRSVLYLPGQFARAGHLFFLRLRVQYSLQEFFFLFHDLRYCPGTYRMHSTITLGW